MALRSPYVFRSLEHHDGVNGLIRTGFKTLSCLHTLPNIGAAASVRRGITLYNVCCAVCILWTEIYIAIIERTNDGFPI